MNKQFKEIYSKHEGKVVDKWTSYLLEWDQIFSTLRNEEINLLEIGIQNGGSLEIWAKYFDKAKNIVGCDINEACRNLKFEDPRISTVIGDVNTDNAENKIVNISSKYEIIIDDGSHLSSDIIRSFSRYFNRLSTNGLYVIEDLHSSYWDIVGSGLYEPYSAISFLKRLVDITNFEHWRVNQSREEYLIPFGEKFETEFKEEDLSMINSVTFLNSLCLIKKRPSEETTLGERLVIGLFESVTNNAQKWDKSTIHQMKPINFNEDSNQDIFSLLNQVEKMKTDEKKKEQEISALKKQITEMEGKISFYANSKSWRITKPLRDLLKLFKGKNERD